MKDHSFCILNTVKDYLNTAKLITFNKYYQELNKLIRKKNGKRLTEIGQSNRTHSTVWN